MPDLWSWRATLLDGKAINQFFKTRDETFETNFSIVLDAERDNVLDKFYLSDDKKTIGVDLTNGRFYINGMWLYPLPELNYQQGVKYRIVFYRRREGLLQPGEQLEVKKYLVGWQATVDGVNYQRIMFLDAHTHSIEIKMVR